MRKPRPNSSAVIAAHMGNGMTENTVRTCWRRGAPRTPVEFAAWYAENGTSRPRDTPDAKAVKTENDRKKGVLMDLRIAAEKEQADIRRRNLVPKSEVVEAVAAAVARCRGVLKGKIAETVARMAGSPADTLQAEIDKAFDAGEAELFKLSEME